MQRAKRIAAVLFILAAFGLAGQMGYEDAVVQTRTVWAWWSRVFGLRRCANEH